MDDNDKAHWRVWSVAEYPSNAVSCWVAKKFNQLAINNTSKAKIAFTVMATFERCSQ